MNYFISDLHLFHKNVTRAGKGFDDRPFDDLDEMHANLYSATHSPMLLFQLLKATK